MSYVIVINFLERHLAFESKIFYSERQWPFRKAWSEWKEGRGQENSLKI